MIRLCTHTHLYTTRVCGCIYAFLKNLRALKPFLMCSASSARPQGLPYPGLGQMEGCFPSSPSRPLPPTLPRALGHACPPTASCFHLLWHMTSPELPSHQPTAPPSSFMSWPSPAFWRTPSIPASLLPCLPVSLDPGCSTHPSKSLF